MVWPHLKVFCLSKADSTGYNERKRRKARQRQKKRWGDNNKKLTGMDFASSAKAAEDKTR